MYGVFGGYTRWAVVFLIIFVLFFLLVPVYGMVTSAPGMAVAGYHKHVTGHHIVTHGPMVAGTGMAYEYESSPESP
ncbi:hypothetical protein LLE49_07220 [Alicyclobacillus tolerans]|uniref:hypothetical protein n=1 Tax=Alicyclobacillus tolerans TaxID=90970 RepID=UPI001F41DCAD|nr:hypothetical protein [Alicyclobacillus tolerans]MCF8564534.1 hypothetical protein [Alicyclobacillus tolerans]